MIVVRAGQAGNPANLKNGAKPVSVTASAIADEMKALVRDAARPISPGEGVKAQQRRARVNLGFPDEWRVRFAWYGRAGQWSAVIVDDFRARYRAWRTRMEARGRGEAEDTVQRLASIRRVLSQNDANFHGPEIAAIERALLDAGYDLGAVVARAEEGERVG